MVLNRPPGGQGERHDEMIVFLLAAALMRPRSNKSFSRVSKTVRGML